jgi:hypothetical protein
MTLASPAAPSWLSIAGDGPLEAVLLPIAALVVALLIFGIFCALAGANPLSGVWLHLQGRVWQLERLAKHVDSRFAANADGSVYGPTRSARARSLLAMRVPW